MKPKDQQRNQLRILGENSKSKLFKSATQNGGRSQSMKLFKSLEDRQAGLSH